MKLFLILALAFVGLACGDVLAPIPLPEDVAEEMTPKSIPVHPMDMVRGDDHEERITNGWNAHDGQLPYQAGLHLYRDNGRVFCGGSLIGQHWILTAAHCTNGAHSVTVYLGSTARTESRWSVTVGAGNIRQHHAWHNGNTEHDIALINIPTVGYSQFIRNIALPPISWAHDQFTHHWTTASGWGAQHQGGEVVHELKFVYLQIMDNGECSRTYGSIVTGNTLCTATPSGTSTCSGDSGGPLVLYGYDLLVGVTSFGGWGGCQSGEPAGFTRVTQYLHWIRDNTGIQG